jgi:hypothetical protein
LLDDLFGSALHPRSSGGPFQNGGRVLAAHDSEDVQQVRNGAGFAMTGFPQIQNVIRRTGLGGEVIDVPVGPATNQLDTEQAEAQVSLVYLSTLNRCANMRQSLQRALGGSSSWHNWRRMGVGSRKTGALGSSVVSAVAAELWPDALPLLLTVNDRKARGRPGLDGTFCRSK